LERATNKLHRTFVAQTEALTRYRTGDRQNVTVQNVSVNKGGQAVVGNITHDRRKKAAKKASPTPAPEQPVARVDEADRISAPSDRDPMCSLGKTSIQ
jgi:hypothetical protein